MLKLSMKTLIILICSMSFFTSCAHYGGHDKCACSHDKKTCAHHQDGKTDKSDEECKDCKK